MDQEGNLNPRAVRLRILSSRNANFDGIELGNDSGAYPRGFNVCSGIKDFVAVREYKRDGKIVRSSQKGAVSFTKTPTNELVKLRAKLAIGTNTVLKNAEGVFNTSSR